MQVEATTATPLATDADTVAVGLFEGSDGLAGVRDGQLAEAAERLRASGEADPRLGRLAVAHWDARRLIVAGLGPRERFGAEEARAVAAAVHGRARELSARAVCWEVPDGGAPPAGGEPPRAGGEAPRAGGEAPRAGGEAIVAGLVEGTLLHAYRFDRYRAEPPDRPVERLLIAAEADLGGQVRRAAAVASAQNRARELGDTPGNDLTPRALADHARRLVDDHQHLRVTVLDEDEIRSAGMGAFAAVAQGSAEEAQLIRVDYDPPSATGPHLGYVGKGLTFDSGGLALKSRHGMEEMKFDMCGGAAVLEAMGALAELKTPGRVTAVVGAAENLPGGRAVKPGDIVRALDGTTIEINNPDAEGRLVLADCLTYARRQGCERLVDLATLTGGVVTALGSVYAGLMSNQAEWGERVRACGERSGDRVWPLPLDPRYAEMVEGRYAQLTNLAERREAQPITAGELLHHFAGDVPWAHIDIAGTAWDVPRPYYASKGATGFGVRLLVELARSVAG